MFAAALHVPVCHLHDEEQVSVRVPQLLQPSERVLPATHSPCSPPQR